MFWKNFRRELIFTTSRLVSVVVIAAVAVLMFVALSGNTYNAERIAQQYFKEQNVADLWVTGVGFDRADFRNVSKIDGIKDVQPRTAIDAESRDFANTLRGAGRDEYEYSLHSGRRNLKQKPGHYDKR